MGVHVVSIKEVVDWIFEKVKKDKKGRYICVSNVHMCMEVFDSTSFSEVVNSADLVIPDGRPLIWAQRLLGYKNASQTRGQDVMLALCNKSGKESIRLGFYGGSEKTLNKMIAVLQSSYPDILITYLYSPPFRQLSVPETVEISSNINKAAVDVLFVGLGCPKQEKWMYDHKVKLNCVMLGVGAAFDFVAGDKRHAPKFLQVIGLEWFFRLLSEPRRLWKRYVYHNPRFLYHFIKQLLHAKFNKM
ncbi:WecB/TagA/CpsF family glycosyltransferase [Alteromonas australica]|uniref:WecB/TagA/CpsF family glycosyltransferase n=1 Tax=Alteromonas australica TaxID=589873 RepID=UPI00235656FF|nr:WecB/TagA/CpsF family glycosyltransferase [Alteromonas australica]|tara:strand:- start:117 stop:851 length:735 start_codon:yes stop_codon:yes gene_type:complete